jgi:PAS domain S-box-containing protein
MPGHINKRLIVMFAAGMAVISFFCAILGFPPGIISGLMALLLVVVFYFDQGPKTMAVYGAVGVAFICAISIVGIYVMPIKYYGLWAIGLAVYSTIYGLLWLYTVWFSKLREISDLHELVIAGTTAGLWKWKDTTKDEQWWSPRYYQLLGYDNNEIPANLKNLYELVHPDDRDMVSTVYREYIHGTRTKMEAEYRMRAKNGDYKWFLGSGEVQFDHDTHKPAMVVGSIVNIDHKKKYEQALAHQAALVSLSPNAIITTSTDLIVHTWNEAAEKIYQIPAGLAIGRNLRDLFSNSYPYITEEKVIEALQSEGTWSGEAHQVTVHGTKVYVLSMVRTLQDIHGKQTGIVVINSDLGLLRVNKELSSALKMVENSTQYLEQLAYVSSNDLKSPIVTLQGLMGHLAASRAIVPGYEASFEMLREIIEQMKSTSVSLSSILQLRKNLISREFATEKVAVSLVLKDVQEMLKVSIESSGAEIHTDVERGLQIRIHHTFLKAIFFNLVSNAIKFKHPDRPPVINIKTKITESYVLIIVADNGMGINLNRYRNKLFTIFTRFHDGIEGNGVGLH